MTSPETQPGWAGEFTDDYWMFVREGFHNNRLWCIKDADTGAHVGSLWLTPPEALTGE